LKIGLKQEFNILLRIICILDLLGKGRAGEWSALQILSPDCRVFW